jgi:hypothetical protein
LIPDTWNFAPPARDRLIDESNQLTRIFASIAKKQENDD